MKLSDDTCFKRVDGHLVSTELDRELVMLDMQSGDYLGVESVARDIWDLLVSKISRRDLIKRLLLRYEVSEEVCREQTDAFLQKLLDKKLLAVE